MHISSDGITILVIETNPDTTRLVETLLASIPDFSFELLIRTQYTAGIKRIESGGIDIVLFDFSQPAHEYLSHIASLRNQAPQIPILILATLESEELALQALRKGAESYLITSELQSQQLLRTIRIVIERHQSYISLETYTRRIQESHARLYNIIGKSGDGIIIVDKQGKIIFVNPAASSLLERPAEDIMGEEFGFPLVSGERTELDIIQGNKQIQVVEMCVEAIVWEDQIAYLSTIRNITERKRTEHALQESEQRYRRLLRSVTDYIYTVTIENNRPVETIHSPNCVAVTGYTVEEYHNDPNLWYRMVYEEDRPAVTQHASWILAGKHIEPLEHRIVHKDGSIRWVKNTYVPRYDEDGNLIAYDGLITDITERRLAEEEVRKLNAQLEQRVIERTAQLEQTNKELENEIKERKRIEQELRKLSRAVEQSPASIVITDLKGNIEYINKKFTQVTGYTPEEARGKNPRILKSGTFPPEVYKELWQTISAGDEWHGEFHNRKKSGELFWEFASISPIVNAQGEITHFLAVKEDITNRKHAEEEVQQARRIAEEATQAKSEFLANMSHEIRTPLNAIIGMTILLKNSSLSGEQHDYVETIRICGDSLLDIINDILDFSKIEAGKMELEYQPFALSDCIEEALDVISAKAAEKPLDLVYTIAEHIPLVLMGDAKRLRQILVNLLSNAVKFTDHGEIVITVTSETVIWNDGVSVSNPRHSPLQNYNIYHLHAAVRDTGIGIPQENVERLFRSFSQVHTSVKHRKGGTGLGLAISKRLAEMMGGTMWVESVYGKGSTFHFTIEAEAAPIQPHSHLQNIQPLMQEKHILILDDNPTVCQMLSHHVMVWGMISHATTSSSEALQWILQGTLFDVAILDTTMPDTDGIALAEQFRTCPGCQTIPLILTTFVGVQQANLRDSGLTGLSFLFKPIKISRLYDLLASILTHKHPPLDEYMPPTLRSQMEVPLLAKHHPLHILVAEDDPFNQKVITLLLERMGYSADIVSSGSEVLAALEVQPYDAILMDVQMPEQNGIETTRTIRTHGDRIIQPYIIAMTAHALAGDREQCLAAGMDNYVSKPIQMEELVNTLWQVQRRVFTASKTRKPLNPRLLISKPQPAANNLPMQHEPSTRQTIDPTILENLLVEIGENTTEMAHELIYLFLDHTPEQLQELKHALEQSKPQDLYRLAHTIKSSSAQLGATRMALLCKNMEDFARQNMLEEASALVQQINDEFLRVRTTLLELLSSKSNETA
jgi:PAS domain S-box-containing protein